MMKLKYIVASVCVAMLGIGAAAAEAAYTVQTDFNSNKITVTGTGAENEKIVFQILKKDKSFTDWTKGGNAGEFILWQDQLTVGEDKTFSFDVPYSENLPAGEYSTRIVSDINKESEPKSVALVGTNTYSQALSQMLIAAENKDYSVFKACIDGGDGKVSPVGFNLSLFNELSCDGTELINYAEFVATNGASAFEQTKHFDSQAQENRSAYFMSFMLIEKLKEKNKVNDIKNLLEQSSVGVYENALWKDLNDCITDDEWEYFAGKLVSFADKIKNTDNLNQAIIEALILTETKYADGNDIKNVIVTLGYGNKIGITNPSTKNNVYLPMNGNDYADIDKFINAYESNTKTNTGSSGNVSGGGGGASSGGNKNVSVPSLSYTPSMDGNSANKPQLISVPFVDIEGVAWASEAIIALADKGIISGTGDKYFEPDENVTREAFTKIIVGAMGLENKTYSKNNFTDVKDDDWFCKYVNIAYENGIINGIGDGLFGSGEFITRQDMSVILCNALKTKGETLPGAELPFEDKDSISDYAVSSVEALYSLGAINGISDTQFQPKGVATRAQAAKIIYGVLSRLQ